MARRDAQATSLALAESGQIDWAIRAFHVALEQNPNDPFPHRCLAQLYRNAGKDVVAAEKHRARADELAATVQSGQDS